MSIYEDLNNRLVCSSTKVLAKLEEGLSPRLRYG